MSSLPQNLNSSVEIYLGNIVNRSFILVLFINVNIVFITFVRADEQFYKILNTVIGLCIIDFHFMISVVKILNHILTPRWHVLQST